MTLGAVLLVALQAHGAEPATRPASLPPHALIDTPHFTVVYDPATINVEQARHAAEEAERAWRRNETVFAASQSLVPLPQIKVMLNLNHEALVWVGITTPGGGVIAIRYFDLPYLGVPLDGLLTHEIAHVFCAPLIKVRRGDPYGPPLSEGIAECVSGPWAKVPLAPWMGRLAQEQKFWFDPTGYFVTGDFDAAAKPDVRLVVATYAEEGLFVQHLVKRFGWVKMIEFASAYKEARHTRFDNASLRRLHHEHLIPDPAAVRAVFKEKLGITWEELLAEWKESMQKDAVAADLEAYGRTALALAALNCALEFRLSEPGVRPDADRLQMLRRQQIAAQQALEMGRVDTAKLMLPILEEYAAAVLPSPAAAEKTAPSTRSKE